MLNYRTRNKHNGSISKKFCRLQQLLLKLQTCCVYYVHNSNTQQHFFQTSDYERKRTGADNHGQTQGLNTCIYSKASCVSARREKQQLERCAVVICRLNILKAL